VALSQSVEACSLARNGKYLTSANRSSLRQLPGLKCWRLLTQRLDSHTTGITFKRRNTVSECICVSLNRSGFNRMYLASNKCIWSPNVSIVRTWCIPTAWSTLNLPFGELVSYSTLVSVTDQKWMMNQQVSVYGLLIITTPSGRHQLIFEHRVVAHTFQW
jgi:hypothetical protein